MGRRRTRATGASNGDTAIRARPRAVPETEEFPRAAEVVVRFGSLNRSFAPVEQTSGTEEWDAM